MGYTDAQFERAKTAWKLYIATGGGGFENFKHYLRQNIIKNCHVTIEDVLRAERIFIKDVGHLKGSTTRKNTKHENIEAITIPPEITLWWNRDCLDVFVFRVLSRCGPF